MKKYLRIALTVAVLASLASVAMADPGGTVPPPMYSDISAFKVIMAAVLSVLGL